MENSHVKQETQVLSLGGKDFPEKGIASHSSVLAWRIPWTGEPGGPQSMGSQRGGRNDATKHTHAQKLAGVKSDLIVMIKFIYLSLLSSVY